MRKKWERIVKQAMDDDVERILEQINNDPNLKDVTAPEEIHDKLFKQIREYEEEREKEEQELIRLGKKYRKNKKKNKVFILLVAVLVILGVGMTSMGGPKRVYEKVQSFVDGKEKIKADSDGQIDTVKTISEVEAYEQVEEEFGFYPVSFDYRPEGLEFTEVIIEKETQNIRLYYEKGEEKVLLYTILPNYRTVTVGTDIEDTIVEESVKTVHDIEILVKKILVEENQEIRWRAEFQYRDVQYFLMMSGFTETEMEQTLENLHFLK